MGLHNGVWNECCRNLASAEPSTIQSLDGLLRRFDGIKFEINFSLWIVRDKFPGQQQGQTWVSLSTLMASTLPYLFSHSTFTSSASSLSQSRSVSLRMWVNIRPQDDRVGNILFRIEHIFEKNWTRLHSLWNIRSRPGILWVALDWKWNSTRTLFLWRLGVLRS